MLFLSGFLPPPNFFSFSLCSKIQKQQKRWQAKLLRRQQIQLLKYVNLRFVHLFMLYCLFQGFYHQLILFFLFHCVAKFINSRNGDKSSRWDDSRSSSWSKYANLRFVHLFILCCFFQGFYHQLIFFFLFHCVAKFIYYYRNDDKSSCWLYSS